MTLTELKYILAIAQEHSFANAAYRCHVSQPSLSVAVKKLETELGVKIFERSSAEVSLTAVGLKIVEQAERVTEEVEKIYALAKIGNDPLFGPLRLGVIYTIGPFLLPKLVEKLRKATPHMPLILSEDFTENLIEELKNGTIDCAILALPIEETGLNSVPLYDEPFVVAMPINHRNSYKQEITKKDIQHDALLLLGKGHCLRDQVLNFCFEPKKKITRHTQTVNGSSLETIMHMVSQGLGITIIPSTAVPYHISNPLIRITPFEKGTAPKRTVAIVWRKSFARKSAIDLIIDVIGRLNLHECQIFK